MNIMHFLTPKCAVAYLMEDMSLRQALEKMEACTYTALPVLDGESRYIGTLTEGDILRYIKDAGFPSRRDIERTMLRSVPQRKLMTPANANATMEELLKTSLEQNFVPVTDDRGVFVGIITRRSIMKHFIESRETVLE